MFQMHEYRAILDMLKDRAALLDRISKLERRVAELDAAQKLILTPPKRDTLSVNYGSKAHAETQ
jgi:hypothetical protein